MINLHLIYEIIVRFVLQVDNIKAKTYSVKVYDKSKHFLKIKKYETIIIN